MPLLDLAGKKPRLYAAMQKWLWLPWVVIILTTVSVVAQVSVWMLDTRKPFELLSYTVNQVKAGGLLRVDGKVRRDLDRECSLRGARYIMDSQGARYDFGSSIVMTAEALRIMDKLSAGEIHQVHQLPAYIAPGPASMITTMQYVCNPLHELFRPIAVDMRIDFEVLP